MFPLKFVKNRSIMVVEVFVTLVAWVCLLTDQFGIVYREKSVVVCGDTVRLY